MGLPSARQPPRIVFDLEDAERSFALLGHRGATPMTGLERRNVFACLAQLTGFACTPRKMAVPAELAKDADTIQITDRSRMTGALANDARPTVALRERRRPSARRLGVLVRGPSLVPATHEGLVTSSAQSAVRGCSTACAG